MKLPRQQRVGEWGGCEVVEAGENESAVECLFGCHGDVIGVPSVRMGGEREDLVKHRHSP